MTTAVRRLALIGADTLLVECGNRALERGHEITVVGAGSQRVRRWASERGIATVDVAGPPSTWSDDLASHDFDWLLAITHLHLLPDDVADLATNGAINFHDGPLPEHRGLNTPAFGIMRGDREWGVTWHLITSGVDEGDIVAARRFEISPDETSLSLNTRNFAAAMESFDEVLDAIGRGPLTTRPQHDHHLTTTRRTDRPPAAGVLDWHSSVDALERLVRALDFGPYPNPLGRPKIVGPGGAVTACALSIGDNEVDPSGVEPGTILSADDEHVVVAAVGGAVRVSALSTLRGEPISPNEALTKIGVSVGEELPRLNAADIEELETATSDAARLEPTRIEALTQLRPAVVPQATRDRAGHFAALTLDHAPEDPVPAAFAAVLSRCSGLDTFHLGVVGRRPPLTAPLARLFSEAAPLDVTFDPAGPVPGELSRVADSIRRAAEQPTFAEDLIARQPDLATDAELRSGGLVPAQVRLNDAGDPGVGVVVEIVLLDGRWQLRYDESCLEPADAAHLVDAIGLMLAAPDAASVSEVGLLTDSLLRTVLEDWNDSFRPADPNVTIHELVERQTDKTPDDIALVCGSHQLTYRELDEQSNRLARHLGDVGVAPGDLVGVHVQRSTDLVVAALAVMKTGGAYVPLDPDYPHDRLAHMIRDSGCRTVVTESALADGPAFPSEIDLNVVEVDGHAVAISSCAPSRVSGTADGSDIAYCIYTSGSTGLPKGVLVEHRNVVNFFVGMDDCVPHEPPATWLAVTSLSFDISVLELFYTLTRGFRVVIHVDPARGETARSSTGPGRRRRPIDMSLFYFSGDASSDPGPERYRLLLDGARFADENGFRAVWTPERHFHEFGGLFPAPSVTAGALAAITSNVEIRAGSVVLPLHHPARVAEAWSVVDNISNGRVGISIASGWQPNDFVLMPQNYDHAKRVMFESADELRRLWRGETVLFDGPLGPVEVSTLPTPVQPEIPLWVTTAGNPETFEQAGRMGANLLTHLLGQSVEQLAEKIDAYRSARSGAGHDPDTGVVSLMLHTFVGDDPDQVRDAVREPLKRYLGSSFSLLKEYAWSFPAFARPAADDGGLTDDDLERLTEEELDAVLEFAFVRYYETSGLFGTADRCIEMIDRVRDIGVDEVACLIDFGVGTDDVLASLPLLAEIKDAANTDLEVSDTVPGDSADESVSTADQILRHGVTHLQCTPSMARMFTMQDDTRLALSNVDHMFVGGEGLPLALAQDLVEVLDGGSLTNMYGPTETTIWSSTWSVPADASAISIGTPIANTSLYVLDKHRRPTLPGVPGELWIGGDGVVRGYHERPELTADRFVPDPFRGQGARMYRTGDLVRWVVDTEGQPTIDFLGRVDHQVKLRGYRIELGEIETQLGRCDGVRENVVVVRSDDHGEQQLLAFVSRAAGTDPDPAAIRDRLRTTLPDVMVPAHVVVLDDLPHTPNGKIDRNGLPELSTVRRRPVGTSVPASSDLERRVLTVWCGVLDNPDIGVDDNFFDVGGHSLLVVRLHRRLKDELDRPSIPLTDLYRFPTVRTFARALEADSSQSTVETGVDRASRRLNTLRRRRSSS